MTATKVKIDTDIPIPTFLPVDQGIDLILRITKQIAMREQSVPHNNTASIYRSNDGIPKAYHARTKKSPENRDFLDKFSLG